ncbi:DUF2798 domain-containing protein [Oxalobacteraceae bacterium OM1]|nr:DUF2798 domain-containing protein [Oxalobacteraceae bacterium OM1]
MIPGKYGPVLFGLILSGLMSLLVSGISTFRTLGLAANFLDAWFGGWLAAWLIAFPVVLLAAPLTRKLVQSLVAKR